MCGGATIRQKVLDVKLSRGRVVRGVSAEVCGSCGELYFDSAAMSQLAPVKRNRAV